MPEGRVLRELGLGFSPCPNDTFIFGALAQGLFPLRARYRLFVEDVEALNRRAVEAPLAVSKLSFAAFAGLLHRYQLLPVGAALGRGCGPVLVARGPVELSRARVAVPGRLTTAAFLLRLYAPVGEMVEMRYDRVLGAVESGEVEAGVLIHEARFVFRERGLVLLADLGRFWEERTGAPIPLGGIFVRRDLGADLKGAVLADLRESLALARRSPEAVMPFVRRHAQEMDEAVIGRHLETFVNRFTYDLGEEGRRAVRLFLELAAERGLIRDLRRDFLWGE